MSFEPTSPESSQPTTMPPPAVALSIPPAAEPTGKKMNPALTWGLAGGLAILGIGGYSVMHSHNAAAVHAAAASPQPSRPADLPARIAQSLNTLDTSEAACSELDGMLPVVLPNNPNEELRDIEHTLFPSAIAPAALAKEQQQAQRVAVIKTLSATAPHASVGAAVVGRYEGELVVIDTTTGNVACHSKLVTWSSSLAEEHGISEHMLQDDYIARVRTAFGETGQRLHVVLDL